MSSSKLTEFQRFTINAELATLIELQNEIYAMMNVASEPVQLMLEDEYNKLEAAIQRHNWRKDTD